MVVIGQTNDPVPVATVKPVLDPTVAAFRPLATSISMSSAAVNNSDDTTVLATRPLATSMSMSSAAANGLEGSWNLVEEISAGNDGLPVSNVGERWLAGVKPSEYILPTKSSSAKEDLLPLLPFMDDPELSALHPSAKPVLRSGTLPAVEILIPGATFIDRALPAPAQDLVPHQRFTPEYFVALGNLVSASGFDKAGYSYPACTPNFLGARIPLPHTKLKIARWRHHLLGYENADLVQHLYFLWELKTKLW